MSIEYVMSVLNSDIVEDDLLELKETYKLSDNQIEKFKIISSVFFSNISSKNLYIRAINIADIFIRAIDKYHDLEYKLEYQGESTKGYIKPINIKTSFIKCLSEAFNNIMIGNKDAIDMLADMEKYINISSKEEDDINRKY